MKRLVIYMMIACQLVAWGWFSMRAGNLGNGEFTVFTIGMLLGQAGAAAETFQKKSWGTLVVQLYFFIFTVLAGVQRFLGT